MGNFVLYKSNFHAYEKMFFLIDNHDVGCFRD